MTLLVITDAGNSKVTASLNPGGPPVVIQSFRIGSDFSTPASAIDEGLKGSMLYQGTPTSYGLKDENTLSVLVEIPAEVGPFEFGEVSLFLDDGTHFGRCSFGSPQSKFNASVSGMPNVWRISILMSFAQAPTNFIVQTSSQNKALEVDHLGLVTSPSSMLGNPNIIIVHEPTPSGDSILMFSHSPSRWTISNYTLVGSITVAEPSLDTLLMSPDWLDYTSSASGTYLVQTLQGEVRAVASISGLEATLSRALSPQTIGSSLSVYRTNAGGAVNGFVSSSQFNYLTNLFNTQWSVPTGSDPSNSKGWGQTPIPTVSPSTEASLSDWVQLSAAVASSNVLLGSPSAIPFTGVDFNLSDEFWSKSIAYQSLVNSINLMVSSRPGSAVPSSLETTNLQSRIRTSAWPGSLSFDPTLSYDTTLTFSSVASMKAFFNSGGWVGFRCLITPNNFAQRVQQLVLESLGSIVMKASFCESTGSFRIRHENGSGPMVSGGNLGFLGLTNAPRVVWNHSIPISSGDSTNQSEGFIHFRVQASMSSTTAIDLSFIVIDESSPSFSSQSDGGTPSFEVRLQAARPNPAILSTPVIAFPVPSVKPSTNW